MHCIFHNYLTGIKIIEDCEECHKNAACLYLGPFGSTCTCYDGYEGNGLTCKGTTNIYTHL